ncbi:MAG TPA: hypothetical protein VFI78_04665, partial [Salinimicrobium sp.]|nr:hypothetical protein [Salinimicrobium sp.]
TIAFNQVYENFEIGEATLSTYISCTRDRDLIYVKQGFVMGLAINALALYLAIKRFLHDKDIDVVYNFNGRQGYVRAIMRAAMASQINCFNVERARMGGFIEFYKNVLPHNIGAKKQLIEDCWADSPLPENEKRKVGALFFERQRKGESVIFPSYLKKQTKYALPEVVKNGNENVVLFNSSDDEFAALGAEFKNPLFKNQNEGIEWLVEVYGKKRPHINFIVRMHPNLAGVTFDYVVHLKNLHQKYPNIHVVPPESKIDSYALIDSAAKVLTFGSTLGLEANFYGKPVILLGKCFYYFSSVAYTPKSKEEALELIDADLKPLPKINAVKFGFYFLKGGIKSEYYFEKNMGEGIYFKGKRTYSYSLYERFVAKIIQTTYRFFGIRLKL